jgi:hypothetical protein
MLPKGNRNLPRRSNLLLLASQPSEMSVVEFLESLCLALKEWRRTEPERLARGREDFLKFARENGLSLPHSSDSEQPAMIVRFASANT